MVHTCSSWIFFVCVCVLFNIGFIVLPEDVLLNKS